jgi:G3E family GTPase
MPDPSRARKVPIPVTVLTGFLGAGKTSLLNRLMQDPAFKDAAFIINEFGEVGIDNLLVAAADEGIVTLSSGCLCCTVRGELVTTLEDFLRRLDNRRIASLSRIVIETTGLADPAPVLHTVMAHPYLAMRYRLDGVVTVVDAVNGAATLDAHVEAVKQVAVADRLVLSKTDLVEGKAGEAELRSRLKRLNPTARLLLSGDLEASDLLDCGVYNPASKIADVSRWLNDAALTGNEHHDHHHDHDHPHGAHAHQDPHDRNRHDDHIRSFALTTDRPIPMAAVEMFLELLTTAHGPKLLRMKGIVRTLEDSDRPLVLHAVQDITHPPVRLESWPGNDRRTRLVFITRDLPEGFVRRMFDAFSDAPAPDTADSAAMTASPLRLTGFTPPSQRL